MQEIIFLLIQNAINPQKINAIRYEMLRIDFQKTNIILGKDFNKIFRKFNLKIGTQDV